MPRVGMPMLQLPRMESIRVEPALLDAVRVRQSTDWGEPQSLWWPAGLKGFRHLDFARFGQTCAIFVPRHWDQLGLLGRRRRRVAAGILNNCDKSSDCRCFKYLAHRQFELH